jgi:hypothetical protein
MKTIQQSATDRKPATAMNPYRTLAVVALMAATGSAPSMAADGLKPVQGSGSVLSYDQMMKAMGQAQETSRMNKVLVGKTLSVKLKRSGPDLLVVSQQDGVFFHCETRAKSFKGGPVKTEVLKIEDTAEGNFMVTLKACG